MPWPCACRCRIRLLFSRVSAGSFGEGRLRSGSRPCCTLDRAYSVRHQLPNLCRSHFPDLWQPNLETMPGLVSSSFGATSCTVGLCICYKLDKWVFRLRLCLWSVSLVLAACEWLGAGWTVLLSHWFESFLSQPGTKCRMRRCLGILQGRLAAPPLNRRNNPVCLSKLVQEVFELIPVTTAMRWVSETSIC